MDESVEENGIERQSLLPPRRRNRDNANHAQGNTNRRLSYDNECNEASSPPATAAAAESEPPPSPPPPPSAQSSVASFYDSTLQSNASTQPVPAYHPPPDLSSVAGATQPFGIPILDPNSMQVPGHPFFQQAIPTGSSFPPPSQPSFYPAMGNALDQQRFMMAWMDIYKYNLGLMQPPAGSANPPEAFQAPTNSSTFTKDSHRTESPASRSSRKRSYSVASNESENSSSSAAEDTEISAPTVRRTPSDPKHIFETEGGSPLSFFVQVDVTNRGAVVSKIKKHGGTMAMGQETADFSVLQIQSKVFKTFLKNSAAVNKPAVSASFIHDCVDNGVLYDHSHFLLQPLRRKRQKKAGKQSTSASQSPARRKSPTRARSASSRPQSSGGSQAPKKNQAAVKTQPSNRVASRSKAILKTSDHSESPSLPPPSPSIPPKSPSIPPQSPATLPQTNVRPTQSTRSSGPFKARRTSDSHTGNQETSTIAPHKNGKEKEKPGKRHVQVDASTSKQPSSQQLPQEPGERSPSPPPAHTRVTMGNGSNYRYPDIEKEFAKRYVKVLFGRDHEMTISNVAQKIHEKMPHHTVGSWMTTLTTVPMRTEVDTIRKRAGILYRKNLYAGTQPENQMQGSHAGGSSTEEDTLDSGRHNKRRKTDESVVETVSEAQIQSDVDIIANFLLSRQSQVSEDEQDEDAFWNLLTAKARCKSAKTWKEFYQKHATQVLAKCEAMQVGSGT